ncbi:MAG: mismatch-specific DNA-glycosylase, partial [Mycobacteriales bacterium]
LGVTNLVRRTTARADELSRAELVDGAARLGRLVAAQAPSWVAIVGITAYRSGFHRPHATLGRQEEQLPPAGIWVLPNTSGLNAHYQLDALAEEFAKLRAAAIGG